MTGTKQIVARAVRVFDNSTQKFVSKILEIEVDWQAVAEELAPKAQKSKSKKSKLIAGAIVGKLI